MFIPDRWSVGISSESEINSTFQKGIRGAVRRIGVQYDSFGCGGAERVAAELIKIYLKLGYEVYLYTNVDSTQDGYSLPNEVIRKILPSDNDGHESRFSFWKKEVESGLDVCVYNSWVSGWAQFDCWALKSLGISFIYYTHNVFTSWFRDEIADYLSRALPWIAARADVVVTINRATADFFSLYSNSVMLLPNPVDCYLDSLPESTYAGNGKNIVWVGRISDEKRPYEAVRIMGEICKEIPDAHMDFIGGNSDPSVEEPERIMRFAHDEIGLSERQITFTGFQTPYPYLEKADIYLQTSEYEGFSLTLAEAMRYGVPCVCYKLDYLPLLESGEGASMVEVGDVKGAANAVLELLSNQEAKGRASRAAYKVYDETCRIDIIDIWSRVLSGLKSNELPIDMLHKYFPSHTTGKKMMDLVLAEVCLISSNRRTSIQSLSTMLEESGIKNSECVAEIDKLRLELDLANDRNRVLQDTLDEILNSKSFKLGEALATPYRKLKSH